MVLVKSPPQSQPHHRKAPLDASCSKVRVSNLVSTPNPNPQASLTVQRLESSLNQNAWIRIKQP